MATSKVLDVSHHNTVTSWATVAKNVDAVIIRAGYRGYGSAGTLATDQKFDSYIKGAIAAGLPVGVYWCSQALSDAEAMREAEFLIDLLAPYKLTYPVYLDSEHMNGGKGRADRIGKARRTQYGLTFCRAMRDAGYKVGLYCSESWFTAEIDGAAFKRDGMGLWIAKYSANAPRGMAYDAWQYTSKGKVSGVNGNVDLSHFYTDYATKKDANREKVKARFGLSDATLDYLEAYQYGADLLRKLATAK